MYLKKRIVVIDDDPGILEVIELVLSDAGYEVEASLKDGVFIKKCLKKGLPDLIILDVLLSGTDGRTICKKLKSDNKTKDIPIIMISAHPDAKDTALTSGANDFIPKPFDIYHLLKMVEKHTGSKGKHK